MRKDLWKKLWDQTRFSWRDILPAIRERPSRLLLILAMATFVGAVTYAWNTPPVLNLEPRPSHSPKSEKSKHVRATHPHPIVKPRVSKQVPPQPTPRKTETNDPPPPAEAPTSPPVVTIPTEPPTDEPSSTPPTDTTSPTAPTTPAKAEE